VPMRLALVEQIRTLTMMKKVIGDPVLACYKNSSQPSNVVSTRFQPPKAKGAPDPRPGRISSLSKDYIYILLYSISLTKWEIPFLG